MALQILATKLHIPPPPPKVVIRSRLIKQLSEGLSAGRKLTLVSAPPGFGKSTLISEWISSCGRPAAWLSLDDSDNNLSRFLTYLISALQTVSPNLGADILDALQSSQIQPTDSILTALLNEISVIPDDFILVLDDFHLTDARLVNDAITFLIERLPPQMHLVITTREDPSLPISRLRARNQLTEIRAANLRFAPPEAAEFLNQAMSLDLTTEEIITLETRTEGWIAGLQLAALSMKGQEDVHEFIQAFAGDHRYIVDYLVEEVLQRQPEPVRNFLLQTSILERLNGPLCDAVTSQLGSKSKLEQLQRGNLFVIPLDDKKHWYRYHHLFADMLRVHLKAEQPDQLQILNNRASKWFEQNGSVADAICHAYAAEDFERVAGLAETCWQVMYQSFQSVTWLGWVKQLPEELVRSRPVLCTQIAWGFMDVQEVNASEAHLLYAERCLESPSDGMVIVDNEQFRSLRARIAFARAYNAQTKRDFLSATKYAELVLELIPEEDQFLRSQATAILGATHLINGDLDAACRSMDDWINHSLKSGNYFSAFAYAMVEKADILAAQGHLREGLRTYQQSLQLAAEHDSQILRVMAHPFLGMAILYHEMGEDKVAEENFQRSLETASLHRSVDWSYRNCIAQARLKETAGELDAALEWLDEAKHFYIKTLMPHTRPIDALKARIYLKQGNLFRAKRWVNEQGLSVDNELIYLHEFEHITLARVLLAEYQSNRDDSNVLIALHLLERLLMAAEGKNRIRSMLEILVTQVLGYQAMGNMSQAHISLGRALKLAEPEGYIRMFTDEGSTMEMLLRKVTTHEIMPDYISKLLLAFEAERKGIREETHPSTSPASASLIEPLSQRELDILRLLKTELSGPEVAQELVIALSTVRTHTKSIYSKLGVNNRRAAVKRATEMNLI